MIRRSFLRRAGLAGLASLVTPREERAQEAAASATRGLAPPATHGVAQPRIRDISAIETQPGEVRLTVVKITTDQDRSCPVGRPTASRTSGRRATTVRTGETARC